MSGTDAQSAIEKEFEQAKSTARAYLQAVRVFDPDVTSTRENDLSIMQEIISTSMQGSVHLPYNPFARHAAYLARQYLVRGYDADILQTLLEKDCSHPAYREALTIVVREMRKNGVALAKAFARMGSESRKSYGTVDARGNPGLSDRTGRRCDGNRLLY